MAYTPPARLPVYVRIGDLAEHQVGTVVVGEDWALNQESLAGLLRAVADRVEREGAPVGSVTGAPGSGPIAKP